MNPLHATQSLCAFPRNTQCSRVGGIMKIVGCRQRVHRTRDKIKIWTCHATKISKTINKHNIKLINTSRMSVALDTTTSISQVALPALIAGQLTGNDKVVPVFSDECMIFFCRRKIFFLQNLAMLGSG